MTTSSHFQTLFGASTPLLAELELWPLPGSPLGGQDRFEMIQNQFEQELLALYSAQVDGIVISNAYDGFSANSRLEPTAAMALAVLLRRARNLVDCPIGVSVLPNDPLSAYGLAALGLVDFIRIPVLIGIQLTATGLVESRLNDLTSFRDSLSFETEPLLLTDVSLSHLFDVQSLHQPGRHEEQAFLHLKAYIQAIEKLQQVDGLILHSKGLRADQITRLCQETSLNILVEGLEDQHPTLGKVLVERSAGGLLLNRELKRHRGEQQPAVVDAHLSREVVSSLKGSGMLSGGFFP